MMDKKYKNLFNFAKVSIITNLFLAVGKLISGIFAMSFFVCVNAMYNFGVASSKRLAVKTNNFIKTNKSTNRNQQRSTVYRCYLIMGMIVLISAGAYLAGSVRLFVGEEVPQFSPVVALAIVVCTVIELSLAIVGAIKTRKINKPIMEAVKLTNFSSAIISLALTQTVITTYFWGGASLSKYNSMASVVFGSMAGLIGLYMIIHSYNILSGNREKIVFNLTGGLLKKFNLLPVRYYDHLNLMIVERFTKKEDYKAKKNIRKEEFKARYNDFFHNEHLIMTPQKRQLMLINKLSNCENIKKCKSVQKINLHCKEVNKKSKHSHKKIKELNKEEKDILIKKLIKKRYKIKLIITN